MSLRSLTGTQEAAVLLQIGTGESQRTVAKAFDVSQGCIRGTMRRAGVKGRSSSDANRRYELNEKCFDNLTPEALYWFGFIYADGCVHRQGSSLIVRVALARLDEPHLEKLRGFTGSKKPLQHVESTGYGEFPSSAIVVVSQRIGRALIKRGVIPRKTYESIGVTEELRESRDFWRGVVDGDGSVYLSKGVPHISLAGDLAIINQFSEYVRTLDPTITAKPARNKTVWQMHFTHQKARTITKALYENAVVGLERKAQTVQKILGA